MRGVLVWVTGLAGAGKTTIAARLSARLKEQGETVAYLDGDVLREICGPSLGYTNPDRLALGLRYSALCRMLTEQGINVVCATIALFHEVHETNRAHVPSYVEVFVDCPMEELVRRDQKGLYSKALEGKVKDVVGVDLPFDRPRESDLVIDNTSPDGLDVKVDAIVALLKKKYSLSEGPR